MLIREIYYGTKSIQRIYQNGVIVWESGEPILLSGIAESTSYDSAILRAIVLISITGTAESTSYTSTIGRCHILIPLTSTAISESDSVAIGRACDLVSMATTEASESDSKADGYACTAITGSSEIKSVIRTKSDGYALQIVLMSSETSICVDDVSAAVSIRILEMSSDIVSRIRTVSKADSFRLIAMTADGITGTSYGVSDAVACPVIVLNSLSESSSNSVSGMSVPPLVKLVSTIESTTDETATAGTYDVEAFGGVSTSTSYTEATVILWYLPIEDGDILEIRQAYSVTEEDDVLEVI